MFDNNLIYGRDKTESVVCIEPSDNSVEVFIETDDGVRSEVRPNKYWLLAPKQYNKDFKKLEGDLFYKYIKVYDSLEEYQQARKKAYNLDCFFYIRFKRV